MSFEFYLSIKGKDKAVQVGDQESREYKFCRASSSHASSSGRCEQRRGQGHRSTNPSSSPRMGGVASALHHLLFFRPGAPHDLDDHSSKHLIVQCAGASEATPRPFLGDDEGLCCRCPWPRAVRIDRTEEAWRT